MSRIAGLTPEFLRAKMEMPGRSQAGLARKLGLDASAVNRMVKGTREIKSREIGPIAEYLAETDIERPGEGLRSEMLDWGAETTDVSLTRFPDGRAILKVDVVLPFTVGLEILQLLKGCHPTNTTSPLL